MPNTAIKVSHLTKIYKLYDKPIDRLKESLHPLKKNYHKDFYALNDVSFEIKKGETVGIIGKNGAGKSTLLKIITGILAPTRGDVHVNGRISSLLELGAGFNPEYTGIENIYLQGTLMGFSYQEMVAKIDDILAFADIGDFIHQSVKVYSSGMFARLAFAVAINVEPDILIVDEALSVGDMVFQAKCMARMKNMIERGITVLFVSHDIYSVQSLCNRAIYIDNGQIIAIGDVDDVTAMYMNIQREKNNISLENKLIDKEENLSNPVASISEKFDNKYIGLLDISGNKLLSGRRSGNKKATILDFLFLDENGVQTDQIVSNNEYSIEIAVRFEEDLESFAVVCPIRSLNGVQEIGVSSSVNNYTFPSVKKDEIYFVKIQSIMNLQAGIYNLVLSIEIPIIPNEVHEFADILENCLTFNVVWGELKFPMKFYTDGAISYLKNGELNE